MNVLLQNMRKVSPFVMASCLNLVLFLLVITFCRPVYDTNEDVYTLYLLSGQFGNAPTELLHYNYGMHPFLSLLLKNLFLLSDEVNWYGWALIVFHFASFTAILTLILKKSNNVVFVACYLLVFLVFEARMLQKPNFTNTSIVCGCAGVFVLYASMALSNRARYYVVATLFLVLGSLFRIHVLAPLVIVLLPFALINFPAKKFVPVGLVLAVSAITILLLNFLHEEYYEKKIPGWRQEEQYRQEIYRFYNHIFRERPQNHPWHTELQLINSGLPIDTVFLSTSKLRKMYNHLRVEEGREKTPAPSGKNWFWINNRIFFATLLLLVIFSGLDKKLLISIAAVSIIASIGSVFLINYYKFPEYLLVTTFMLTSLLILFSSQNKFAIKGLLYWIRLLLTGMLCVWAIIQVYKIDKKNRQETNKFKDAYSEISTRPNQLFLQMGGAFPLQKFHVFDLPKNFPIHNLLTSEHFLHNLHHDVLKRFGIGDIRKLYLNSNVLFLGKPVPALLTYFSNTNDSTLSFIRVSEFKKHEVYRISKKEYRAATSSTN